MNSENDDVFELYKLKVEVTESKPGARMVCNHKVGDYFLVSGENLSLPNGQSFSIFALASLLPLLPSKQRVTAANDWMSTDNEVACPDPNCSGRFKITRIGQESFRHQDVTLVPLGSKTSSR